MRVAPSLQKIGLIGFGQMGQGIAQAAALNGYSVHLYEVKESVLRQGMDKIQGNLMKMFARTKENISTDQHVFLVGEVMERLHIANNLEAAVTQAGLLIEAVKEDHALKADIFREIFSMKALGEKTIICTNTSSFQVSDFASLSPVLAPRIAGLHFFNPVDKMKLVEIIKTERLLPEVLQTLCDFVTSLGKSPVVCKDSPGFIVNHLLIPYLLEAIRLAEDDVASIQDIDTAMKLGAGYPMGPFELLDLVGLDTVQAILAGWHARDTENSNFAPSHLLDSLVRRGNLGRKTGAGFYDYKPS